MVGFWQGVGMHKRFRMGPRLGWLSIWLIWLATIIPCCYSMPAKGAEPCTSIL